jgi:chemosensory pili system protein ChpA (sensor histidine kinase/response regulator)
MSPTTGRASIPRRSGRRRWSRDCSSRAERLSDEAAKEMILRPGFSTAEQLTQSAGRGVGMDVVASQVQKLGGSLRIESRRGQGTRFIVRLPYTLAITQALVVKVGDETVRAAAADRRGDRPHFTRRAAGASHPGRPEVRIRRTELQAAAPGQFLGGSPSRLPEDDTAVPVILVRAADQFHGAGHRRTASAAARSWSRRSGRRSPVSPGCPVPRSWATAASW